MQEEFLVVKDGMGWTLETSSPCFWITTVTATSGLLCDKKADVVVVVIARTEAPATQDTALVKRTVPKSCGLNTSQARNVG